MNDKTLDVIALGEAMVEFNQEQGGNHYFAGFGGGFLGPEGE